MIISARTPAFTIDGLNRILLIICDFPFSQLIRFFFLIFARLRATSVRRVKPDIRVNISRSFARL